MTEALRYDERIEMALNLYAVRDVEGQVRFYGDNLNRFLAALEAKGAPEPPDDLHTRYVNAPAEIVRLRLRLGEDPHTPIGAHPTARSGQGPEAAIQDRAERCVAAWKDYQRRGRAAGIEVSTQDFCAGWDAAMKERKA